MIIKYLFVVEKGKGENQNVRPTKSVFWQNQTKKKKEKKKMGRTATVFFFCVLWYDA